MGRRALSDKQIEGVARQSLATVFRHEDRMAQCHRRARVAIHQYHVQKEDLALLHKQRIAFVKHWEVHPDRVVDRAHPVAAGL